MITTLHIELTNRCNLKCPICPRTRGGIDKISDISQDAFKNLDLHTFKRMLLIGCLGDSLYYPYLNQFFVYTKSVNKDIELFFGTNGLGRDKKWWSKLHLYLPENHRVIFALDGVDNETLNKYRIGSNYDKVIRNMRSFIDSGGTAEWQFILFKHNEDQVERARELAEEYGAIFALRTSYYYSDHNKNALRPTTMKVSTQAEKSLRMMGGDVVCRIEDSNEIFVDSFGRIMPCCLIAPNIKAASRLSKGIVFNVHKHSLRKCISDYYINRVLDRVKESEYCKLRCKVPFETMILERTKPNE